MSAFLEERASSSSRSHLFFIFRRSDGPRVSVDTVHPSLLRSSSFSSPRWYHLESLSSDVVLVSPLYVAKPPQSCFPAPLCDILYLQSLPDVIDADYVGQLFKCPGNATFTEDIIICAVGSLSPSHRSQDATIDRTIGRLVPRLIVRSVVGSNDRLYDATIDRAIGRR